MNNLENFSGGELSENDSVQAVQPITLVGHFIQGGLVTKASRTQPVYHPATGAISKEVTLADSDLVNQVVQIAQQAFPA